jgi:Gti1/Pac2 family transcription factor
MNSASELDATYYGFIGSTYDALILFEACIAGRIKHVSRRPHDRERERVIQSGRVFIYEENTSGIKRWTDGISWSPSRILGNFLIYRQLVKAFGPGEKKKAIKRPKAGPNGVINNNNSRNKENIVGGGLTAFRPSNRRQNVH